VTEVNASLAFTPYNIARRATGQPESRTQAHHKADRNRLHSVAHNHYNGKDGRVGAHAER